MQDSYGRTSSINPRCHVGRDHEISGGPSLCIPITNQFGSVQIRPEVLVPYHLHGHHRFSGKACPSLFCQVSQTSTDSDSRPSGTQRQPQQIFIHFRPTKSIAHCAARRSPGKGTRGRGHRAQNMNKPKNKRRTDVPKGSDEHPRMLSSLSSFSRAGEVKNGAGSFTVNVDMVGGSDQIRSDRPMSRTTSSAQTSIGVSTGSSFWNTIGSASIVVDGVPSLSTTPVQLPESPPMNSASPPSHAVPDQSTKTSHKPQCMHPQRTNAPKIDIHAMKLRRDRHNSQLSSLLKTTVQCKTYSFGPLEVGLNGSDALERV